MMRNIRTVMAILFAALVVGACATEYAGGPPDDAPVGRGHRH